MAVWLTGGFLTSWNTIFKSIKTNWLHSFDFVNSIIKAFLFLVEWKFARMKIHYSFHSVIINFSLLESCLEVIAFWCMYVNILNSLSHDLVCAESKMENILAFGKVKEDCQNKDVLIIWNHNFSLFRQLLRNYLFIGRCIWITHIVGIHICWAKSRYQVKLNFGWKEICQNGIWVYWHCVPQITFTS